MRTFYSLTKRQFLGMTKFNKFLYGNSKEKKVFTEHEGIMFQKTYKRKKKNMEESMQSIY